MKLTTHQVDPEQVMAFLDGELPGAHSLAISSHLERCTECSAVAEQLRNASGSLSRWNAQAVTAAKMENSITDAAAKTCSRLKVAEARRPVSASFWTWRRGVIASGGTLAALLVVAAVFSPVLHRSRRPGITVQLTNPGEFADQKPKGYARKVAKPNPPVDIGASSAVSLASPGIAADSNGLFHGLGDHAANSFSVDGQPIADQESKVFSPAVPAPMIARSDSLSIVVKDFATARSSLDSILARRHGYSAQLGVNTPENAPRSLQASLRVPVPELASVIADLKSLGRVENESQSGEEVTQQHTDLVARLKTSRETEQRFRSILEQRTGNVSEVLQVEEGIARVRGDIERMEAEQKALEHRVDFSAIELQITEDYKAQLNPPATSVSTRIHNAFVTGYRDASETLLGILLLFVEYGPTVLIFMALLILPVFFVWRRYRRMLAAM